MTKRPLLFEKGAFVFWKGKEHYGSGHISVRKRTFFGNIYRVKKLGPFAYYWLDEKDLVLDESKPPVVVEPRDAQLDLAARVARKELQAAELRQRAQQATKDARWALYEWLKSLGFTKGATLRHRETGRLAWVADLDPGVGSGVYVCTGYYYNKKGEPSYDSRLRLHLDMDYGQGYEFLQFDVIPDDGKRKPNDLD